MSGEGLIAEPRAVHPSAGHARLKSLMQRGTAFLGCEVAIMGGAMSWVSERHLVSAISNAGGFGVIACGAMSPELLDTEIAETKARTDRPFGVNLITMHPQLGELIDTCARHEIGHVVLAGGLPPGGAIERIKGSGARLVCFAPACTARGSAISPSPLMPARLPAGRPHPARRRCGGRARRDRFRFPRSGR
jgi:enoyl-[acyl-carrier protein] reductase II